MIEKELIPQILAEYQDRSVKVKDIERKYHIDTVSMGKILKENGIPYRRPNMAGKRNSQGGAKRCPKCHKHIQIKGAKFCCFCGADIRSQGELLIEKQTAILSVIELIPQNSRDEVRDTVLETIAYLEKEL